MAACLLLSPSPSTNQGHQQQSVLLASPRHAAARKQRINHLRHHPCHTRRHTHKHIAAWTRPVLVRAHASPPPAQTVEQQSSSAAQSITERVLKALDARNAKDAAGGAGAAATWEGLLKADAAWHALRNAKVGADAGPPPQFVRQHAGPAPPLPSTSSPTLPPPSTVFDVAVCGGTLGIFLAVALRLRGWQVAVIERGPIKGRDQDWNISRSELVDLVHMGVLTAGEVEECINIEFNPNRVGFKGAKDLWVEDILNIGVSPREVITKARDRFLSLGGCLLEFTGLEGVDVYDDAALLGIKSIKAKDAEPASLRTRLVVDVMGNFSPIVRQARWGTKPDGVCLVAGACARGFDKATNTSSDVIYTATDIVTRGDSPSQYFWEAFPAGSGPRDRTTYLFTYLDAHPSRPSLLTIMEDYWQLMPQYQGLMVDARDDNDGHHGGNNHSPDSSSGSAARAETALEKLEVLRVLFGFFGTYRSSPLRPNFDRVIQAGDASGIQSPLSFGGFGALARHLSRLTNGISDALEANIRAKGDLAAINPYLPNLSIAWFMQRAMSAPVGTKPPPGFINYVLGRNFAAMEKLGDAVLRPFLQDVIQFVPLARAMIALVISSPAMLPQILIHLGPGPLLDWFKHFIMLAVYMALYRTLGRPLRQYAQGQSGRLKFRLLRLVDAWEYGSGSDYTLSSAAQHVHKLQ
eukprot:jgi/Chlat1/1982/Chrsp158S00127